MSPEKKNSHCETARPYEVYTAKTEINALEFSAVEKGFIFLFSRILRQTIKLMFCHSLGRDVRPSTGIF